MKNQIILAKAIDCDPSQIIAGGDCTIKTNELLGIKQNGSDTEATNDIGIFVQDIFLGATFFIGTLVTLALIRSGLKLVFSGGTDPKAAADAKKGIQYSLIGLVLVIFSYTIVRLIQYIVGGRI